MVTEQSEASFNWRDHSRPLAGLVVICVVIIALGAFYSTREIGSVAYAAGQNVVYALVIWLVYRYLFGRSLPLRWSLAALAIIFGSLMISSYVSNARAARDSERFVGNLQRKFNELAAETGVRGLRKPIAPPRGTQSDSGRFGVAEQIVTGHMDRALADRNAYQQELEQAGLGTLFDFERLKADAGAVESRRIIQDSLTLVEKYRQKSIDQIDGLREQIRSADLPPGDQAAFLAGFEQGVASAADDNDEMWRLEREIVHQYEKMVDVLSSGNGWSVTDGELWFELDSEAAAYNEHSRNVNKLVETQERKRAAVLRKTNRQMDAAASPD